MPYILNKTNGTKLVILDDASLDISTDLTFVGRNYSGYGEIVNENFLKLLENFSNNIAPPNPILGQIWFNNSASNKNLNVYDGVDFKSIANIHIDGASPASPLVGELWWDSVNNQLNVYDGSTYKLIGPLQSVRAAWKSAEEYNPTSSLNDPIIKAIVNENTIAIVSDNEFIPALDSNISGIFPIIKSGITLAGADTVTGSSTSSGYYFWGTAAESLMANTATTVTVTGNSANTTFYVPFVSGVSGNSPMYGNSGISFNPSTGVLGTIASSARYADLAERYRADAVYDAGTVLIIGGDYEVTTTRMRGDTAVVGIVSTNPGYMMNSDAGPDDTHPYIALKGRVPCKVFGPVNRGDLLVSSVFPGHAEVYDPITQNTAAIMAKAINGQVDGFGVIEVLVI